MTIILYTSGVAPYWRAVSKLKSPGFSAYFLTVTGDVRSDDPEKRFQSHEKEEDRSTEDTANESWTRASPVIAARGKYVGDGNPRENS